MTTRPEPAASKPTPPAADFVVDLEGFEGPIDLLLTLAREQKVDLAKISILALADQYLAYIQQARDLKLEIAADYLVTAAWLTYLKSRLLLPQPPAEEEPSAAELAEALANRLRRLDAIRRAGEELLGRAQLGTLRFGPGRPAGLRVRRKSRFRLALHELLQAYVDQRLRTREQRLTLVAPAVFRVEDALKRLARALGGPDWRNLLAYLPADLVDERLRRSALAAHLAASLELVRDGVIELSQATPFGPIFVRRKR
jgi:segregation and condensation protein A